LERHFRKNALFCLVFVVQFIEQDFYDPYANCELNGEVRLCHWDMMSEIKDFCTPENRLSAYHCIRGT